MRATVVASGGLARRRNTAERVFDFLFHFCTAEFRTRITCTLAQKVEGLAALAIWCKAVVVLRLLTQRKAAMCATF